jgi:hypothetical protein
VNSGLFPGNGTQPCAGVHLLCAKFRVRQAQCRMGVMPCGAQRPMHLPPLPGTGFACSFPGYEHGQHHRQGRAERGALCTFHRYPALVLLAPSTAMGTVRTTTCFSLRDSG